MRTMIRLDGVEKTYPARTTRHTAIGSVSLEIAQGELVCIVGPSGCGKSTLLNMIAGKSLLACVALSAGPRLVLDL